MVVTKAVNHRADGTKYPLNPPEGWVSMPIALETFGPLACEKGGSFMDFTWAWVDIPKQNPLQDKLNAGLQAKAKGRIRDLARAFSGVLISGEVKSAYSRIGGGGLTPMEPDLWRTDDPYLRYRTFSFDPAEPFSDRVDLPCWIWIEEASLRKATDRLYRERKGWGPLPDPAPRGPRTEYYVNEDGKIETYHFDELGVLTNVTIGGPQSARQKAGRPSKTTRIQKLFADHIRSGAVAKRVAWEGAAISREYGGDDPPKPETCADRIRPFYNLIVWDDDGNIINGGEVLDAMQYPTNPDKSLYLAKK